MPTPTFPLTSLRATSNDSDQATTWQHSICQPLSQQRSIQTRGSHNQVPLPPASHRHPCPIEQQQHTSHPGSPRSGSTPAITPTTK
eukprot:1727072-Pyramimonas_sp.AAC.1